MTRIMFITPKGSMADDPPTRRVIESANLPGLTVDVVTLDDTVPPTAFLPLPSVSMNQLLQTVERAEKSGYDAVAVSCAADPGVAVAKTLVSIPVTGPLEAALHTAAGLGGHLGVVTAKLEGSELEHQPTTVNWLRDLVQAYGMNHRIAGIRSVYPKHPVGEEAERLMREDPDRLADLIENGMREAAEGPALAAARELVIEHDATAVFFACTQWGGLLDRVRAELPVPVLDPVVDTIRYAAHLAWAGRP